MPGPRRCAALIRNHFEEASPRCSLQHDDWQETNRYMGLEYLAKMMSTGEAMTALAITG